MANSVQNKGFGAWCSHCNNQCSEKNVSTFGMIVVIISIILICLGLVLNMHVDYAIVVLLVGLIVGVFLPREWHCKKCQHRWRA